MSTWRPGPLCQIERWLGIQDGTFGCFCGARPGPANIHPTHKTPAKASPDKTAPVKTAADTITADMLKGIAAHKVDATAVAHYLSEGVTAAGITTATGRAMFIAETAVESQYYTKLNEGGGRVAYDSVTKKHRNFHPKKDTLSPNETEYDYFTYLYDVDSPVKHNQEHARRMGNVDSGDGPKYKGRGYIQITGKKNYAAAGKDLNLELVKTPDLAAQPENAAKIAGWYWKTNGLNAYSDTDSDLTFKEVSYLINVGSLRGAKTDYTKIKGLTERQHMYVLAKTACGVTAPAIK